MLAGTTVKWINNDSVPHTVTEGGAGGDSSAKKFDSGILGPGQTFEHAFDQSGTVSTIALFIRSCQEKS